MKRRGFTLLEMLVSLIIMGISYGLIVQILLVVRNLSNSQIPIQQKDVFELQFQHEIMTSSEFSLMDQNLCYQSLDDLSQCIVFDNSRIVKTPGYEILLTEVNDLKFTITETFIQLDYIYQEKGVSSVFKIVKK